MLVQYNKTLAPRLAPLPKLIIRKSPIVREFQKPRETQKIVKFRIIL